MDAEGLRNRTKRFAIDVIYLTRSIGFDIEKNVIKKQIVRSATSVAANYRAACRARSDKEFFAKICIIVEEVDETLLWLEIIEELSFADKKVAYKIKDECDQLVKIFNKIKFSMKKKLNCK